MPVGRTIVTSIPETLAGLARQAFALELRRPGTRRPAGAARPRWPADARCRRARPTVLQCTTRRTPAARRRLDDLPDGRGVDRTVDVAAESPACR